MSPGGLKGSSQYNFSSLLSTKERKQIQSVQSVCKVGAVIHGTNTEMAASADLSFLPKSPKFLLYLTV